MPIFSFEGNTIAYQDRGAGEIIVIVHGTPTNSNEYKKVMQALSSKYRFIAIDHLGFGDSDKPNDGDYTLEAHQRRLKALLHHLDLKVFHLLLHDFGAVISFPLVCGSEFSVQSITVLNSWLWPLIETEPQMRFQTLLVSSGVMPFLYRWCNFSPRILFKLGWGKRTRLAKKTHQYYMDQFPSARERSGPIGFLKALFEFENPGWQQGQYLLKLRTLPVQIIWGTADRLLSLRTLERWKKELPNAQIHTLSDVGHFVAEEAPEELTMKMERFLSGLDSQKEN